MAVAARRYPFFMSVMSLIFVAACGLYVLYIYRLQADQGPPFVSVGSSTLRPGDPAPVLRAKEGLIDPADIRGRQVWVFLDDAAPLPDSSWCRHFPDTLWIVPEGDLPSVVSRLQEQGAGGRPVSLSREEISTVTGAPSPSSFPLAVFLHDGTITEIHEGAERCRAVLRGRNGE